jgi:ABC-type uncharacterized transport system substrate-binding protein
MASRETAYPWLVGRKLDMKDISCSRFVLALVAALGLARSAEAHPHVWVSAKAEVVFDAKGMVEAIRNIWVFDEMYSAFVTEGQNKNGKLSTRDDLAPLAKSNVDDLAAFGYFTFAKTTKNKIEYGAPIDASLEERADKRVVLRFTLPLKTPASAGQAFSLQIYDPTYFVAFELEPQNPLVLVGAPKGCSANIVGAKPLETAETKLLSEAFFSGLSPGADFGIKLASRMIVACP